MNTSSPGSDVLEHYPLIFIFPCLCLVCFSLLHHAVSFLCSSWVDVQVEGTSLPAALRCWEQSFHGDSQTSGNRNSPDTPAIAGCPQHVIDSCRGPQCNPTCPKIYDPQTGQEINMMELLEKMEDEEMKTAIMQEMERGEEWLLS